MSKCTITIAYSPILTREHFDNIFIDEHFNNLIYAHELNLFSSDFTTYYFSSSFGQKCIYINRIITFQYTVILILKDNINMILVLTASIN